MSNRVNWERNVNNMMESNGYKMYDKIDIFIDVTNQNNQWAILQSNEIKKGKPYKSNEIIRFLNNDAMLNFLRNNFNCYELNHAVDISNKHIFFHFIEYSNVNFMLHEGKPRLNYIELNYREYANGTFYKKKIDLPKEYEGMFDEIIRISKKIPMSVKDIGKYHLVTDVYGQKKAERGKMVSKYTMPINEYISKTGSKIANIKNSNNKAVLIKRLKIVAAATMITTIMASGYHLMTRNIYNSDYLEQHDPIKSIRDVGIYFNKGDNGIIIDKLMEQNYEDVSVDDLKKVFSFLTEIDKGNYDDNSSFNSFAFDEYFDYKLLDRDNYFEILEVLRKIENLYKRSFILGDKVTINFEKAEEYVNYVSSLTFMYDNYHDIRGSNTVPLNNGRIVNKTATTKEMSTYDSLPPILRLIIMTQLRGMLKHIDYQVTNKPTYYFKSLEKVDLLKEIDNIIANTKEQLYSDCGYKYIGR